MADPHIHMRDRSFGFDRSVDKLAPLVLTSETSRMSTPTLPGRRRARRSTGDEGRDVVARHHCLHELIANQLRAEIRSGVRPPHGRIPSESMLCASFRVSRVTVRQALGKLERDGLIVRHQGKGSFVTGTRPDQDLGRLTGLAEALATQGRVVTNHVLALRTIEAPVEVAGRLQLEPGSSVVELSRVRCVDTVPVSFERSFFPGDLEPTLRAADLARRDVYLVLEEDARLTLDHADWRIDAVPADAALADALQIAPGAALMRVERLAFTPAGRPVDFEYLHYRGDAFQYRLRTDRHPAPCPEPR